MHLCLRTYKSVSSGIIGLLVHAIKTFPGKDISGSLNVVWIQCSI